MATKELVKTKTHIELLLDESGSMGGMEEAVINGINEFVHGVRDETTDHNVVMGLTLFDNVDPKVRNKFSEVPINEINDLTAKDYNPRGGTPLLDAVAVTINALDELVDEDDKAMLVIYTDGYENSSTDYTKEKVQKLIAEKEEKGWAFIFLGAGIDAFADRASGGLGLNTRGKSFSTSDTVRGTGSSMKSASSMASLYTVSDKATYDKTTSSLDTDIGEEGLSKEQEEVIAKARSKAVGKINKNK